MPIHPPTNPVDSTTKKPGDSIKNPIDTTRKGGDSTKNPIDSTIETQPPVLLGISDSINSDIGGFYVGLPTHYKTSGKKYPLLFFMCGAGVYGNGKSDLPLMLKEALPLLLKQKVFPPDFLVNGQHFSFIVMAPQFKEYPDNPNIILDAINYAKANYPIDQGRIYLTGISNGSVAGGYLAEAYPQMLAATVPIAGVTGDSAGCKMMADAKLPIWAFHNKNDQKINTNYTIDLITMYNDFHPAIPARLTLFSPYGTLNHDAWTKAMNPGYKEDGKNMYEWMLQYSR